MSPTFKLYWNIPGYIIFYIFAAMALGIFVQRAYRLYTFLRLGGKRNRFDRLRKRTILLLTNVLGQWCTLNSVSKKDLSGGGHSWLEENKGKRINVLRTEGAMGAG